MVHRGGPGLLTRALSLASILVILVALGCGGENASVSTVAAPGNAQAGGQPKSASRHGAEPTPLRSPAARENAKRRIRAVVHRFFVAASHGDSRTVCSLFSPRGLGRFGGRSACRTIFGAMIGKGRDVSQLTVTRVSLVEDGKEGIVELRNLGKQFELEDVDGKWVITRAPGR